MVWFKYRTIVHVTSNNDNKKNSICLCGNAECVLFHAISFDTSQEVFSFGYTCMCLYLNISAKN